MHDVIDFLGDYWIKMIAFYFWELCHDDFPELLQCLVGYFLGFLFHG